MPALSKYDIAAENGVLAILNNDGVAFRNEFHYRLEYPSAYSLGVSEIFHERIDAAINRLVREERIIPTYPRGRPPSDPIRKKKFFRLPDTKYNNALQHYMRIKNEYSSHLASLSLAMGTHAELLWVRAFQELGYNIEDQNTNEYDGKKSILNNDIDIIVKRDEILFGVEIKNGLAYPRELILKYQVAAELGLVPIIVTRNISYNDRLFLFENGGRFKIYQTSIYKKEHESELKHRVRLLRYPIIFRDKIDPIVVQSLNDVLDDAIIQYDDLMEKVEMFLEANIP